jgi:UDP-glucose 4-epimerase
MSTTTPDSSGGTLSGQTILVTGGAGFIGGHLVESLVPGNEVRVLDDLSAGSREHVPDQATLIEGDVRDEAAVRRAMGDVDVVFHLAAVVNVARSVEEPIQSHSVNVDGTLTVFEEARRNDARVVLASSAAIYGSPESVPIDEEEPPDPESPYGLDKLTVDRYAAMYHDLYDLETVRIRPFNAYGPGQSGGAYSGVISIFTEQARAGEPITVEGDGTQTRDFVHVRDLVRAFRSAATTDHVGEAFNIGTGTSVSIQELAELVREVTGSASAIEHVEAREGDVKHSRANISKAEALLGYEPRVGLVEGLGTIRTEPSETNPIAPSVD